MTPRAYRILVLVALASRSMSAAAEDVSQFAKPRSWTAFYAGSARYTGVGGDLNATRYGVSLGSDMEFGGGWLAGGSVSIGKQHFEAPDSSGDSNDLFLSLYARKSFLGDGYVVGSALLGWHDVTTLRNAVFEELQGKVTAQELGGHIEAGYRWWLDSTYSAAPFFAVAGETIHTPAYGETSLSGLNLFARNYGAYDSTVAHTELGTRIGRSFEISQNKLWVEATLGWAHQLDDTPLAQTVFFGVGGFSVSTIFPARETALLGLNLQAQETDGLSYGARFDSQVGGNTTVLSGMANVAWRW